MFGYTIDDNSVLVITVSISQLLRCRKPRNRLLWRWHQLVVLELILFNSLGILAIHTKCLYANIKKLIELRNDRPRIIFWSRIDTSDWKSLIDVASNNVITTDSWISDEVYWPKMAAAASGFREIIDSLSYDKSAALLTLLLHRKWRTG